MYFSVIEKKKGFKFAETQRKQTGFVSNHLYSFLFIEKVFRVLHIASTCQFYFELAFEFGHLENERAKNRGSGVDNLSSLHVEMYYYFHFISHSFFLFFALYICVQYL